MSLPGHFYRAFAHPAPPDAPLHPIRQFLRNRILFDLVAIVMQARDLARVQRIAGEYKVDDDYHRTVHDYNAKVTRTKQITTTRRAEEIYQILALPPRDASHERLLIVGPRNVQELYMAWLYGYRWSNIDAIDLYSTNPKIIPMNMEAMEFPDASYDAVTMSATLAYAEDTARAIGEVARILRPGGRFVFGGTYDPTSTRWNGDKVPARGIKAALDAHGLQVYFHIARDKINARGNRQTTHRFGVRKPPTGEDILDPLPL